MLKFGIFSANCCERALHTAGKFNRCFSLIVLIWMKEGGVSHCVEDVIIGAVILWYSLF